MSQLTLRFSVVERNERGQEVELVRKALQFKPQVNVLHFLSKYFCLYFVQCGARPRLHDLKQSVGTKSYNQMLSYLLFDLSRAKSSKNELDMKTAIQLCSNTDFDTYFVSYKYSAVLQ